MRILYCAIDQVVPGPHGGSVHVAAVAEGLAALGHDVHALVTPGAGTPPGGSIRWHAVPPPLGLRQLRLTRAGRVRRLAERLRPDVIIERYYNFGGEGLLAARRVGAAAVLEVNAPVVDYPGSPKRRLDRLLLLEPLRRWRDWQCAVADLIITPSAAILPRHVPPDRILETEWGVDETRFHPGAAGAVPFERGAGETIAVFVGAFRAWHGADRLVDAIERLHGRGRRDVRAVLIGEGPELPRVRQAARAVEGVTLTGALPHDRIPACLAAADIGVAPFDPVRHPPLALGFYWSPLKIFEYMASGLPVVVPRFDRLVRIVGDGVEGLLYDGADPDGLAASIERLTDPALRAALGAAARRRAERDFGWRQHCERIDEALRAAVSRRAYS